MRERKSSKKDAARNVYAKDAANLPSPAIPLGLQLLLGGALLVLWVIALLTYSSWDAAFSTSGEVDTISNWLGKPGAWVADVCYFCFGFSAWVGVAAALRFWLSGLAQWIRKEDPKYVQKYAERIKKPFWPTWRFWGGLLVLMVAACSMEWSRLHSYDSLLPAQSGGVLGHVVGGLVEQYAGFLLSGLLWVALLVLGIAWVFRFSWMRTAEAIGAWVVGLFVRVRRKREKEEDIHLGEVAAKEREAQVHEQRETRAERERLAAQREEESGVAKKAGLAVAAGGLWAKIRGKRSGQAPQVDERQSSFDLSVADEDDALDLGADAEHIALQENMDAHNAVLPIEPVAAPEQGTPAAPPPPPAPVTSTAQHKPASVPRKATPNTPATPKAADTMQAAAKQGSLLAGLEGEPSDLPSLQLLDPPRELADPVSPESLEMTSRLIEKKLKDFGVKVEVMDAAPGPVITRYEIDPDTGVKGSKIVNLSKDLARSLSLMSIRVIETVPGKAYMALELPNTKRQTIRLSEVLCTPAYQNAKSKLTLCLGKDIVGEPVVANLAKMPHVLVAGTTGSGKSVGINAMILSLLYKATPQEVRFMMIDPKMLEMSVYEGIPHLLCPVVTDMSQAGHGLNWCVAEMDRRYRLMSKMGVRNLAAYNDKIREASARGELIPNPFSLTPEEPEPLEVLPNIVIVIDELADLIMVVGKQIEHLIARLAQKARAASIHLIVATQRPSVDVITGLIKANIPTRIGFQVSSKVDSRTILDQAGAETLLGMGDMLYLPSGVALPTRVHGAFVSDDEVHRVVDFLKQTGEANYIEGVLEGGTLDDEQGADAGGAGGASGESDPLYDKAVDVVLNDRKSSVSYLQRRLGVGFNRAARLVEEMERAGILSAANGNKPRKILVPRTETRWR